MENISKLREKISALLKKTAANGASEAEVNAAMSHAAKLMEKYSVTMDDINKDSKREHEFVFHGIKKGAKRLHYADKLVSSSIAVYTDTKCFNDRSKGGQTITYFGYSVDVELADYILSVCRDAMDADWKKFSSSVPRGHRAKARKSFMIGMATRLAQRLRSFKDVNTENAGSTELVVLKNQLVEQNFQKEIGLNLRPSRGVRYNENYAAQAGRVCADNVKIHREFADKTKLRIGAQ